MVVEVSRITSTTLVWILCCATMDLPIVPYDVLYRLPSMSQNHLVRMPTGEKPCPSRKPAPVTILDCSLVSLHPGAAEVCSGHCVLGALA